jgi:hypothetical protein
MEETRVEQLWVEPESRQIEEKATRLEVSVLIASSSVEISVFGEACL